MIQFRPFRWVIVGLFSFILSTLIFSQYDPYLQIRVDVVYLSSDDLQGRETGTEGEVMAAEYIQSRMSKIGLSPKGNEDWLQPFKFSSNPHGGNVQDKTGRNVIGFLNKKAKKTIVIGAHYDHLGHGATGSLAPNDHSIHNGADDNASGIASMLYLAENLKNDKKLKYNVLFIAFSGEEFGLFGSKAFMENPTIPKESILAMINMDMVGRLNAEKTIAISGVGTAIEWKDILESCKSPGFTFNYSDGGIGPSDHTSFYLKEIPVLHFFTGQHKDYHKPSDDSPLVNYEGIFEVSQIIWGVVQKLSEKTALSFQKTKDENKQQSSSFKVTMGIMPDYVFNGEGMRIDAVLDNRPAQKAGLEAGDIIIQVGGFKVKDVYEYMEALSKFEKGQSADVKVKRKDLEVVKKVDF
ncbi:MAG: M20/M25/M40 family metallo-hydrolase [Saprospiraceae bacterium]